MGNNNIIRAQMAVHLPTATDVRRYLEQNDTCLVCSIQDQKGLTVFRTEYLDREGKELHLACRWEQVKAIILNLIEMNDYQSIIVRDKEIELVTVNLYKGYILAVRVAKNYRSTTV